MKKIFLIIILALFCVFPLYCEESITTVILLRHAEKQTDPPENPLLSADGTIRAQQLIHVLGKAGIQVVLTSQYDRTKLTAAPLADYLKIKPEVVDASDSRVLVKTILEKHAGKTILVVGHSNTVPEIVSLLGAKIDPIEDWQFDNLYVVTIVAGKARAMTLRFGAPTE